MIWPYRVEIEGFDVEQIDGVIYEPGGLTVLAEAKDYEKNVSFEPIAKMRSQLLRRPAAAIGTVFSRNGFTHPAKTLAQYLGPQTILLWEGAEFGHALRRRELLKGLKSKYRHCVEYGLSDFNLISEN